MRIAHVHGNHVREGTEGISRNVESLAAAQRAAGDEAQLAAAFAPLEALNRRANLAAGGVRAGLMAARLLRDPSVDAVDVHVSLAGLGLFAGLARAAVRGRKPLLVHAWNALHDGRHATPRGCRGRTLQRVTNGPSAVRWATRGLPDLVVSSLHQARQLGRAGYRGRVHIVPNGVDGAAFAPASPRQRQAARRRFGLPEGPVVLYYGHLSPWKGVDTLVQALPLLFGQVADAHALLSVTSYGGKARGLQRALRKAGLGPQTTVVGPQPVPLLHAAADVAVVPARAAVGTACHPNVLLESMSAGLPVVASAVGSIPEVVVHGRNGLLVPPGDPAALAGALAEVTQGAAMSRRLGQAARRTTTQRFRWEAAAKRLAAIFRGEATAPDHPLAKNLAMHREVAI